MDSETIKALSALLTPVVAAFAVFIAYRQYATARDNLKLALFDRRYAVYRGVIDLFAVATEDAVGVGVTAKDLHEFSFKTHQKRFLFGEDITDYLKEVHDKALKMMQTRERINRTNRDDNEPLFDQLVEDNLDYWTWFNEQLPNVANKFQPYLGFRTNL